MQPKSSHSRGSRAALCLFLCSMLAPAFRPAIAQEYGGPDRGEPGDERIQAWLLAETVKLEKTCFEGIKTEADWERLRPKYKEEYFYMLGLWPLPERTPLNATVTGQFEGNGYRVEMLHYQSLPKLYVTANVYLPSSTPPGGRMPAVLYVCGHASRGRNGNKTAYQSHGIWFARHGYACLMVDTLQLGEIAGIHHGTYRENRWSWHSRGYTPAGVECWNGMRGIDYLIARPDVDAERIAVTGASGGGAATFWIAAADERVKAAVPVSGMADLTSYVPSRVINGHCDCMFLYNTFGWPWTRIAGLVAPRPLLFVNSDQDDIFPMDANERVINRLKRLYSVYGASDGVDCVVSVGGHAYRKDIRQAEYRFINTHLKNDPRRVLDSEVDLVVNSGSEPQHPIPPERLRVFRKDSDIPKDELNSRIDEFFVPVASPPAPGPGGYDAWRKAMRDELRRVTFRNFPERIPPSRLIETVVPDVERLETEPGIEARLRKISGPEEGQVLKRVLLSVAASNEDASLRAWSRSRLQKDDILFLCEPRGIGETRWTRKNPPNHVERAHALLGRTVDAGRVWDIVASARWLQARYKAPVCLLGRQNGAVLAAYAAMLEPDIAGLELDQPTPSHREASSPALLNVLRVCDVADVLGMVAPRPLALHDPAPELLKKTGDIYRSAGAADRLSSH